MVPMFGTQSVTFWYPTPFHQFRTIVRPPNPYLPLSLTLKGREGEEGARAPPRPSRLTRDDLACPSHVLPTDRQTPPAGRVDFALSKKFLIGTNVYSEHVSQPSY